MRRRLPEDTAGQSDAATAREHANLLELEDAAGVVLLQSLEEAWPC